MIILDFLTKNHEQWNKRVATITRWIRLIAIISLWWMNRELRLLCYVFVTNCLSRFVANLRIGRISSNLKEKASIYNAAITCELGKLVSHHQLQDALRIAYPPHHWEWIHHFRRFDILSHHQLQPVLRMAYTPITENGNTYFRRLMFQAFSVQLMLTY